MVVKARKTLKASMVFFTCNACGSSLKKNQVEKHYHNECRKCSVLSCMDCGQDFHGDEYEAHTKCISEAEKYQGSMFKGKGNKGDKKQNEWLEKARLASQSAQVSPRLSGLLVKISEYPNIPRKKSKFENFVRNSCGVWDQRMLEEVWNVFNQEVVVQPAVVPATGEQGRTDANEAGSIEGAEKALRENEGVDDDEEVEQDIADGTRPKKKKKRKAKLNGENETEEVETNCETKEHRGGDEEQDIADGTHTQNKKKKKKKTDKEMTMECEIEKQKTDCQTSEEKTAEMESRTGEGKNSQKKTKRRREDDICVDVEVSELGGRKKKKKSETEGSEPMVGKDRMRKNVAGCNKKMKSEDETKDKAGSRKIARHKEKKTN